MSIDLARGALSAFAVPEASNHRNMVSRARRLGYIVRHGAPGHEELDSFGALYRETMARLHADDAYMFSRGYFETLAVGLGSQLELFSVARPTDGVEAMAMVLWGPRWGHYHLSARRADGENCSTNLILQTVAEVGEGRGVTLIHLGGGRGPAPDDSLLRFKSRIGSRRHAFRTAHRVLDPEAYGEACSRWEAKHGRPPTWFLGYRQRP